MKRPTETIETIQKYIRKYNSLDAYSTIPVVELIKYIEFLERQTDKKVDNINNIV